MRLSVIGTLIALLAIGGAADGTQGTEAKAATPDASDGARIEGRRLFTGGTTPSCAVCHTLRDAGGSGKVGPDLDELKPDAGRVANAVQNGFENMPAFGNALSPAQIDTLARYVAGAAGEVVPRRDPPRLRLVGGMPITVAAGLVTVLCAAIHVDGDRLAFLWTGSCTAPGCRSPELRPPRKSSSLVNRGDSHSGCSAYLCASLRSTNGQRGVRMWNIASH